MKERMIAGFNLKQTGIIANGQPIKCVATIPEKADIKDVAIDANGSFVLFAEIWSHPEGTEVRHKDVEVLICATKQVVPPGNWEHYKTLVAGLAIFHVFFSGKLSIVR